MSDRPFNLESVLRTATAIAREAGDIVRSHFGNTQDVTFKGEVNPVTEADLQAEALILERLQASFPEHQILAEEGGLTGEGPLDEDWLVSERPIWTVDPLDGTNNFAHGFPHLAVALALLRGGEPLAGVVHDPLRDETFTATAGGGAALNGQPIRVSDAETLGDAFLATGFPYDRRSAQDNNVVRLDLFLRRSQGVRRAGCAALDLAYVACGRFDGFWEIRLNPWDVAAGALLVREAGGQATNFVGGPDCLTGAEIVASNGHIHAEMIQLLRSAPAS
jgi:myo-inositol-1(or 4)-monophosphatase